MIKVIIFLVALLMPISAQADMFDDSIIYYDYLKTCTPHAFSYPHPFVKGFTGKNIIKGKQDGKCRVEIYMPGNMKMDCAFSKSCISVLTSEEEYENARNKRLEGSSSSPKSKCMSNECKMLK